MPKTRFHRATAAILGLAVVLPAAAQQAQMPTQSQMKASLQAYVDAVNNADPAKAQALFAPDATIEDPLGSPVKKASAYLGGVTSGKVKFALLAPISATNKNVATITIKASIGPTNINAVEIYSFNPDGKIANMTSYWGTEDRK